MRLSNFAGVLNELRTPPQCSASPNSSLWNKCEILFCFELPQSSITQPLQDSPGQTMFLSMFLTLRHSVTSKHTIIVNIQTSDFLCNYTLNFFLDVS